MLTYAHVGWRKNSHKLKENAVINSTLYTNGILPARTAMNTKKAHIISRKKFSERSNQMSPRWRHLERSVGYTSWLKFDISNAEELTVLIEKIITSNTRLRSQIPKYKTCDMWKQVTRKYFDTFRVTIIKKTNTRCHGILENGTVNKMEK